MVLPFLPPIFSRYLAHRVGGATFRLGSPRLEVRGRVQRVTINFAGRPIWFETADAPLQPSPEAAACLALLPAMHYGTRVISESPLDSVWLANARQLAPIFAGWWEYPADFPIIAGVSSQEVPPPAARTGLCFTGGVDSFHSLLRGRHAIDYLVFVHGFDIPLGDRVRMEAFASSLQRVAAATGTRPIVVRTNLREHPLFAAVSWERTHGGALAAVGHLLAAVLGRLFIPSSFSYEFAHPWGSHWQTDSLWSSPLLEVVHDAADLARLDKVPSIAGEPLLWDNLRVCWENLSPSGNCSRCEKCLRTMALLAMCGRLQHYRVFDTATPLARWLDNLPKLPPRLVPRWEVLGRAQPDPDNRAAIERLLDRSRRLAGGGNGMSKRRLSFVNGLILLIIGLSLLATILRKELWPFSPYAMYSDPPPREGLMVHRLFGVAEETGEEFLVTDREQLKPFGALTLNSVFANLQKKQASRTLLTEGVRDCFERYEQWRRAGRHDGPPLRAMKLYRLRIPTDRLPANVSPLQQKELLVEVPKENGK